MEEKLHNEVGGIAQQPLFGQCLPKIVGSEAKQMVLLVIAEHIGQRHEIGIACGQENN